MTHGEWKEGGGREDSKGRARAEEAEKEERGQTSREDSEQMSSVIDDVGAAGWCGEAFREKERKKENMDAS